jgi:alpha-amylase/alpha-mannosidase (GH57 family)
MVKLALLWHMHQPYYEDLATGEHILPWVRLHAIKDYWGMVAMLEAFPRVHVTFNLVPSLLVQVEAFAANRARDRHLEMGLKPAADLTEDEGRWLVANGFHAQYGRMIGPHPRYAELYARREHHEPFGVQELLDLQVWHKLTWMDPDLLAADARLRPLTDKGRDFSEADKAVLRAVELELLGMVIPAYRAASDRGQVELATSPFYHPILPLLCDSAVHLRAHPDAALPRQRFVRPEDARAQIARAIAFHERTFGRRPAGMWPSEGSVSDDSIALMAEAGMHWIATDEDILSRSLNVALPRDGNGHAERPDLLYRPYRVGPNGPAAFFRDHTLSDRIGFHYQSWDSVAAAHDFIERVREAGRRFSLATGGEVGTVAVILDGENAWEHFEGGGRPFLRALYGGLEAAADIETVTMAQASSGAAAALPSIFPGSWINADFYIWIGHRDDHRAWTQLGALRSVFDACAGSVLAEARDRAFEEILIAEGSDWFWWYGDDHSSDHDREFDDLFRRHLRNAYAALGAPVPDELHVSNISTGPASDRLEPSGPLDIILDGRQTSDHEWAGADSAPLTRPAGVMHEADAPSVVSEAGVGLGATSLCIRLAGRVAGLLAANSISLAIVVSVPEPRRIVIDRTWVAADAIVEVCIPFGVIGAVPGSDLGFNIQVCDEFGRVLESLPVGRSWTVPVPLGQSPSDPR